MANFSIKEPISNRSTGYKILLFLVSPFFSFVYSLCSIKTQSSKIVIYLYCIFFGLSFTVNPDSMTLHMDSIHYKEFFEQYAKADENLYLYELRQYMKLEGHYSDYFINTVAFVTSRFTDNYHYFFLVIASIFAFFHVKCISIFVSNSKFSYSVIPYILLFFFSWNTIFNINGMRFWTAAWIAVYATLHIIYTKQYRYFALALITPLIHGSFFLFIVALSLGVLLKKYEKSAIALFIISFFFSSVVVEIMQATIDIFPNILGNKLSWYASTEALAARKNITGSGFYWVDQLFNLFSKFYLNSFIILLIIFRKKISNIQVTNLFRFSLIYISICNFLMVIPSTGGRFIVLAYSFIALVMLDIYAKSRWLKITILILPFAWLMNIYYLIKNTSNVIPIDFYFSNPLLLIFKNLIFS